MAGTSPAMTAGQAFYFRHCHGKLRQIKPEQLGRSAKTLLPGDRIELLQPVFHRLAEVITALAERGVARCNVLTGIRAWPRETSMKRAMIIVALWWLAC
jgi:hypothetical protein